MATSPRRPGSGAAAVALAALGAVLAAAAWNAWDPLPPNGPPLSDSDRLSEVFLGLVGLALFAGGAWYAGRGAVERGRRARGDRR
jgi:hypothetical protein